jgi:hypothetical protein
VAIGTAIRDIAAASGFGTRTDPQPYPGGQHYGSKSDETSSHVTIQGRRLKFRRASALRNEGGREAKRNPGSIPVYVDQRP